MTNSNGTTQSEMLHVVIPPHPVQTAGGVSRAIFELIYGLAFDATEDCGSAVCESARNLAGTHTQAERVRTWSRQIAVQTKALEILVPMLVDLLKRQETEAADVLHAVVKNMREHLRHALDEHHTALASAE
jgi:hypothetical protein